MALSDSERAEYLRCHKEAFAQYQRYRHGGLNCINRHLLQLIGLTHPLRLICAGGALRPRARPQPSLNYVCIIYDLYMACCICCTPFYILRALSMCAQAPVVRMRRMPPAVGVPGPCLCARRTPCAPATRNAWMLPYTRERRQDFS